MKKVFVLCLVACFAGALSAQRIQFQQGDKSNKRVTTKPQLVHILEGLQDNQLFVVEPLFNPAKKTRAIKVRLCNMEWEDEKDVKIDDTKNYNIETAFRNGNTLHLLLSFDDRDFIKLRHVALDVQSFALVADEFVVNHEYTAAQNGVVWAATSPDGTKHCAVLRLWSDNGGNYAAGAQAFLFDNDMKLLWKKDLKSPEIHQVIVTDGGEVVTSAMGYVEDNENEAIVLFNLADANGATAAKLSTHADLNKMTLLNYRDGKVLLTALEGEGSPYRRAGLRQYSGFYACCYDISVGKMVAEQHYRFTPDDIRIFENADNDDRVDATTNSLNVLDNCATLQGGAVLVNKNWKYEMRGKNHDDRVYNVGMLLFQIDMDGKITRSPIRQSNCNFDWPPVGTDIFPYNDKLYIVTNESDNETDKYDPEKPAIAPFTMFKTNTALAIYTVTPEGQVSKQMLEKERKAYLGSRLFKGKDNKFYFLSGPTLYPTKISCVTIP